MYLAWSMNYFHINIENREKAMPLIFKPLGLEVLLVFLFFFFFHSFLFFWPWFCFVVFVCFSLTFFGFFFFFFGSRCLRFNLLQGQILTVGELILCNIKSLHVLVGPGWWDSTATSHCSPKPLWFSVKSVSFLFVCPRLPRRNNLRANLGVSVCDRIKRIMGCQQREPHQEWVPGRRSWLIMQNLSGEGELC